MGDSTNIYRRIAQVPEVNNAEFIGDKKDNDFCVEVTWLNRDLLKMQKVKSYQSYFLSSSNIIPALAAPQASDVILRRISPSGKKVATVFQNAEEMYILIVEPEGRQKSINLKELDAHGMIYSDPYISSLEWSTDEKCVLYIAEEWRPTPKGYYDSNSKINELDPHMESKYLHRDDWGEQMQNQHQSVVVKLDIYNNIITAWSVGSDLTAGEATFVPFTHDVVGAATVCYPVRLGRAYSSDREAVIFHIHNGQISELSPRGLHAERPRFSPDGTKLIYVQSSTFGPIVNTAQLWLMEWSSKQKTILLDYVADRIEVPGSDEFRGICAKAVLPLRCWDSTSSRIYFSSLNKNTFMLGELDVDSKKVRIFPSHRSHVALDVKFDKLLVKQSSATEPDCLLVGQLSPKADQFLPSFRNVTAKKSIPELPVDWYDIWEFAVRSDDGSEVTISAMYVGPKVISEGESKRPLILWPHGGPHAIRVNAFSHWWAFLIAMGYSILLPNYRGSSGMGQKMMNASAGKCGRSDVNDCRVTLDICLKRFTDVLDASQIYGIGLSHGGFLTCHLVARYPDLLKAVVLMNSAIDIQIMATASDIPEWAYLEYGLSYEIGRSMDKESAIRMYERSPISYVDKIKTPALLLVGTKDVRCPPAQTFNLHRLLLARNIPTRMFTYPDNHPLASLEAESDAVIQITRWFREHSKL